MHLPGVFFAESTPKNVQLLGQGSVAWFMFFKDSSSEFQSWHLLRVSVICDSPQVCGIPLFGLHLLVENAPCIVFSTIHKLMVETRIGGIAMYLLARHLLSV